MRRNVIIFALVLLGAGSWWMWENQPDIRNTIEQYVENGDFLTLEARYTPKQLMENHRKDLLADGQHSFQDPAIKYYPYLLLDVKYVQSDKKTRESKVLWCLTDGEMVLDTENWETTHGFEDAINAEADRNDFKVIQALAKNGGSLTREQLQNELRLEPEAIAPWIKSALTKHLIVQNDGELQLHFQNPKIQVQPQTKIKQNFVSRSTYQSSRVAKKYSASQVEKMAQAAFGPTFSIRETKEVYLPVYWISVQNPDGTTLTTYWNAISGQRME